MNWLFVIVTPKRTFSFIVDKQSTVYHVNEKALNEALDNDEPIHPALCHEYNLHSLLECGVDNPNALDEMRP